MPIRPATTGDAAAIGRLLTQLEYPGTERFLEAMLPEMLKDSAEVLLVWDGPPVRGFVSLHFIPMIGVGREFAHISYFIVDDTARSEGIGRQLEEDVTRIARERGCDRIVAHCDSRRVRAHAFYLRQGFIESPKYLIKRL
jgi:GNAT superfamily N-acetyltransferase